MCAASALPATAILCVRVSSVRPTSLISLHGVQQAEFVSKYFQKGSLIAIEGSLQTRQYQDKNGNNRTAVEVVANNISFAGPKSSNQGGGANYQNSAPAYQNAAPARPAAVEAAPSYSAGNADDFAVIDDSDDLPF